MKIYKIKFNEWDFDQYDSFIVRAENKERAIELLLKKYPKKEEGGYVDWSGGYEIEEIPQASDVGVENVILGSFNAG